MAKVTEAFNGLSERTRVVLLLAIAMLVYANTLPNAFTYDDEAYILHNPAVRTLSPVRLIQATRANNVVRPVTFVSFALNWALAGAQPLSYHLVNLLLHAGVALLLYLVLRILLEAMPRGDLIAFVSALLFAVHPIHTEAVASIVGRSELLAAGFLLAAWLLHLKDRPVASMICLALALFAKESAVVFVPMAIAGDYARDKWKPWTRYVAMAGVAALYLLVFWKLSGGRFGEVSISFLDNPLVGLPAGMRILNALHIARKYVGLLVYPAKLSYDYSYNAIPLYADWRNGVAAVGATAVVLALWLWTLRARRNAWMLAGAIYLGAFSVTANILVPTGTIMGERLAYLPSAGFCLLVALLWGLLEQRAPKAGWALLAVLLILLGGRTWIRNRDWANDFTLFSSGVQASPGSARTHRNLGDEYARLGEFAAARAEFQAALQIYPRYPEAIENYGLAEYALGHERDGRRLLEQALSMTPKGSMDYDFMEVNLAAHLMRYGQNEEALRLLNDALNGFPGYSLAWSNRALIRYEQGDAAAARADVQRALQLDAGNRQALALLGELNRNAAPPAR